MNVYNGYAWNQLNLINKQKPNNMVRYFKMYFGPYKQQAGLDYLLAVADT